MSQDVQTLGGEKLAEEYLFVPVACTLDRCSCSSLPVGTVIVYYMLAADIFELTNLVCVQVFVIGSVPPLIAVLASIDITTDFAGVETEALERCNEGSCVPIQAYLSTVGGPSATVPQTCIDAHSLAVGEWHSHIFAVLEDANGGSVHVESGEREGV